MANKSAPPTWFPELKAMGYSDDIPAPSKFTQLLLMWIKNEEFHQFIIDHQRNAIATGESITLLNTVDVNGWGNCVIAMSRGLNPLDVVKQLAGQLNDMIDGEFEESKQCLDILNHLEEAIAYNSPGATSSSSAEACFTLKEHPMLADRTLNDEAVTIMNREDNVEDEDFSTDKFRKFYHPIVPSRIVEELADERGNKMWTLWSLQLLAPFSIELLMFLSGFKMNLDDPAQDTIRVECMNDALYGNCILQEVSIDHITMNMFDARRCSSPVKLYLRGKLNTGENRGDEHYKLMWNWHRPYIKCSCTTSDTQANQNQNGCKSCILWLDQTLWFMLHHLDIIFPNCGTNEGQFAAFIRWLCMPNTRLVVRALLVFYFLREMMLHGAAQYATNKENPKGIMDVYGDYEGAKNIKRMIMPPSFTTQALKSKRMVPQKRQLNLNVPAHVGDTSQPVQRSNRRNYRGRGRGSSRGGFNNSPFNRGRGNPQRAGGGPMFNHRSTPPVNTPQPAGPSSGGVNSPSLSMTPRRLFSNLKQ